MGQIQLAAPCHLVHGTPHRPRISNRRAVPAPVLPNLQTHREPWVLRAGSSSQSQHTEPGGSSVGQAGPSPGVGGEPSRPNPGMQGAGGSSIRLPRPNSGIQGKEGAEPGPRAQFGSQMDPHHSCGPQGQKG